MSATVSEKLTESVSERLSRWAMILTCAEIPIAVQHSAARHLLDGVGLAIAAHRLHAATAACTVARTLTSHPGVRMIGGQERLAVPGAALANGVLVHALDFDDTHYQGLVHATAVTLPAAFAVGQSRQSSGSQVLAASVVGFETVCRVAAASPHGFHARGLHATSVSGALAAALVTSRLCNASETTASHALGIAGSTSGGLLEFLDTGSDTKTLHPGLASMNGVIAAELAAAGGHGPNSVLEGKRGLYAALSARSADPGFVVAGLGETWETSRISIKPIPACQLMHVTLDAARGSTVPVEEIVRIEAVVHPDSAEVVCEPREMKNSPRTAYDAKFSLPWSLAAQFIDGEITIASYPVDFCERPEVIRLARLVEITIGSAEGDAAEAAGLVRIHSRDGSVWEGSVSGSRGTASHPISDDSILAKFRANCGDSTLASELSDLMLNLSQQPNLDRIHDLAATIVTQEAQPR
jgi:2-methylcitrate dehydratase PrpD